MHEPVTTLETEEAVVSSTKPQISGRWAIIWQLLYPSSFGCDGLLPWNRKGPGTVQSPTKVGGSGMHPAVPRRCLTSQERLCSGTQVKMIFLSVSARAERVTSQSVSSLLLKTHSKCLANWLSSRKWWTKPTARKSPKLSQTGQRLMETSKGRICENFGGFLMAFFSTEKLIERVSCVAQAQRLNKDRVTMVTNSFNSS